MRRMRRRHKKVGRTFFFNYRIFSRAMMDFCFFLTLGKMDDAFKAIQFVKRYDH